jgi:EAL domain-containing protein (putative c-di-GMP-specific phosphodiesterase class I)
MLKTIKTIPFLQPFYDVKKNKITGYEILLRVKHKKDKRIIIPEKIFSDYYMQYEKIIINIHKQIFNEIFPFFLEKNPDLFVSVNISLKYDWENEKIRKNLINFLDKNKYLLNNRLVIEILEDHCCGIHYLDDRNEIKYINEINELKKEYNFKIALDDFGNGYSNLKRYFLFNTDIIKIDGFLINNFLKEKVNKILKKMKKMFEPNKIIFEYIDSEEKKEILKDYCDYMQGYLFGSPVSFYDVKNLTKI